MRRTSFSCLIAFVIAGCGAGGGDPNNPGEIDNGFESDDPTGRSQPSASGGATNAGEAPTGAAPAPSADGSKEAARAVEEADIIQQDGNRLYALSRYGGLAIVDTSDPDHLKLLGRKRTDGMPFEMYVRNGRAYVMLNDFGRWVAGTNGKYGQWVQTSEIVALDVANPAAIKEVTHYDVPGSIADSRVVGDALYLVTYENGYCWGCGTNPSTVVTSFNVAGSQIAKVDQLQFSSPNKSYSSWQRSLSATNERLYIAGPEWSWDPSQGSTNARSVIQVVDIKDPGGHMIKGADVPVNGQINSRWQMDEFNGVLRVVSQYGNGWSSPSGSLNPMVQTFTVTSATSITKLGETELVMPHPETLQSVRFDGVRGYAITSQRKDPLYTIDLSDPAHPAQAAALTLPGYIFHMEPRGDRLVGFGYDETNWNASLAVSLFDVTDLKNPQMLSRVSFGKGWGSLPEDQDRMHKAVRVLDDAGLILVPFASYGTWSGADCSKPESGIQIIDYSKTGLVKRGVAPQYGMPRRALLANDRLLAMSDRNISTFDIANKDAPAKTNELALSNPAYRMVEVNDQIGSITNDWWSGEVVLSLTPKANADDASITGKISLAALAEPNASYCGNSGAWASWYEARLFSNGNFVYVAVPVYTYGNGSSGGKVIIAAIDASNPLQPKLAGKTELKLADRQNNSYYGGYGWFDGYGFYGFYGGQSSSLVATGQQIVQLGSKLAYLEVDNEYTQKADGKGTITYELDVHRRLHVADLADAANPTVHPAIDLGDSRGSSPLHLLDGKVVTSRWSKSTKNPNKVRFFMDRVDIAGAAPVHLASINTPGSLVLVDDPSNRLVTVDYTAKHTTASDWTSCQKAQGWRAWWDSSTNDCVTVDRAFKLADISDTKVTLRQTMVPPSQNIGGIEIAEDRVYVTRYARYDYSAAYQNGAYQEPALLEEGGLWAIGGIRAGQLSIVSQFDGDAQWPLAASGTKVALYTNSGLAIYDTASASPTLVKDVTLRGWGYASHVLMSNDHAVASLGEFGLQSIQY